MDRVGAWVRLRKRAEKKVKIAIDKIIALQNMGMENETSMRVLEMLNILLKEIRSK